MSDGVVGDDPGIEVEAEGLDEDAFGGLCEGGQYW